MIENNYREHIYNLLKKDNCPCSHIELEVIEDKVNYIKMGDATFSLCKCKNCGVDVICISNDSRITKEKPMTLRKHN